MFKIDSCELIVQDGEMSAAMTMSGTGYLYLYPGTGEEAVQASEDEYISFTEGSDGTHTFLVPVKALDEGLPFAAFSKRKEKWYDRTLVFLSTSVDPAAFANLQMTTVEDLALEDGEYLMDATLSGGSGKASIASPARVIVENGAATVEIIMSSKNYDYMLVDDVKYLPIDNNDRSAFEIPVSDLTKPLHVIADTVAMSTPHEIEYTITFDSDSIQ